MPYATYANVEAAIQALQARGEKITVRAVRQELGGGSLEDIGELIGQVLMGEPAADNPPALPGLPYDLPPLDEAVIQHHLRQLEGEAQAMALMSHLQELVNASRAVQAIGQPGINWLFRAVQALGERSSLNMVISTLGEDLRQVSGTAEEMLVRMRREYARVKGNQHEEEEDGRTATGDREPVEASDAEPD
jgi:hypothetical protein